MHRIRIQYLSRINWALLRAGIPALLPVEVENTGDSGTPLWLRIWVDAHLVSDWIELPGVPPGTVQRVAIALLPDFVGALNLSAKLSTRLRVSLNGCEGSVPIEVLPPDEWHVAFPDDRIEYSDATFQFPPGGSAQVTARNTIPVHPQPQLGIAAFVSPEYEFARFVKSRAVEDLALLTQSDFKSLNEFLAVGGEKRRRAQEWCMQALLYALRKLYPKLIQDRPRFSLELESQRLRLPGDVLGAGDVLPMGTCVDLAVLVLSVMEALGIGPLLFVLARAGAGGHALVGFVSEPGNYRTPVMREAKPFIAHLAKGDIQVIDVVEFFRTGSLPDAYQAGKLASDNLCYAVVLQRPPYRDGVAPLPFPVGTAPLRDRMQFVHPLQPALHYQARRELGELCQFWRQSGGGIMEVVGLGGSGKTCLVSRFLELLPNSGFGDPLGKDTTLPPPGGLLIWSFAENADCQLPVDMLAKIRAQGVPRILVVLDAMEQIQADRGPAGFGAIVTECHPLRIDLRKRAQRPDGVWVVLTSRMCLSELSPFAGPALSHAKLGELDRLAARSLLSECGVKGTDDALDRVVDEYGRHPLTLSLVASLLCNWFNEDPQKTAQILDLLKDVDILAGAGPEGAQAAQLSRVLAAYEKMLGSADREVLGVVLASGSAVATPAILQRLPGLSQGLVYASLARLTGLFLLNKVESPGSPARYWAHPLVTTFFRDARITDLQQGLPLQEEERLMAARASRPAARGGTGDAPPIRTRGIISLG